MDSRQIPTNPLVLPLTSTSISLLTDLCFREDNEANADTLFICGTRVFLEEQVAATVDLLSRYTYQQVILTGGIPRYEGQADYIKTEADILYEHLRPFIPASTSIVLEKASTSTLGNVTESCKLCDLNACKTLLFIAKSFAAGRTYLTLKKYMPETIILQKTYNATYLNDTLLIERNNWHHTNQGRERVWGEFLRIKHYGKRGDIAYKDVASLVEQIETELQG